jgi:hypothetical protein
MLEAAGLSVTSLDMSASGVNTKTLEEVVTFDRYNEPLIEFMANLAEIEKENLLQRYDGQNLLLNSTWKIHSINAHENMQM